MKYLILIAAIGLINCTDSKGAKRTLEAQGYTYIEMTGYDFFSCGEGDWYHTGFLAKSISGMRVSGVVCSGLIAKGSTIRLTD